VHRKPVNTFQMMMHFSFFCCRCKIVHFIFNEFQLFFANKRNLFRKSRMRRREIMGRCIG
jgi:hypothetical protein